ncbi:MAG: TonB-dependent copper receptor [Vicinamibacterales bacterium]
MKRLSTIAVMVMMMAVAGAATVRAGAGTDLHGLVQDETRQPLPGVTVRVVTREGAVVGQTTTGRDGRWVLVVELASPAVLEIAFPGFRSTQLPIDTTSGGRTIIVGLSLAPQTEHVVVTAAAESAPFKVVMDAKQPRQPIPAHDGAEYLETIPGFATVRKGGSGGDPMFRGMAGSRLSILSDGAMILGGCSARMDAPTAYIFPETYDEITVIKGPQSVKYGPAGSAGTVLFQRNNTRLAQPEWSGNASATVGAWGRNDQVFDAHAGTPAFYVRGAASRSSMDNYQDGDGQTVHSEYMRWNMDTAFGWTPNATTRLEVTAGASDGHAAYADRAVDGAKFLRTGGGVTFEKTRPGALLSRIDVAASYNYVDHIMDNYSVREFQASPMSMFRSSMNPDRTTYGGRAATTWTTAKATVETGADLQVNEHTGRMSMRQDTMPVESLARVADARFTTAGVFAELDYRAAARTRWVSGLRVDRAEGTDLRQTVALSMMSSMPNPTADSQRTDVLPSGFSRIEHGLATMPASLYLGVGHVRRFPDYWELITKESGASLSAFGTRPEATTQVDAGAQIKRGSTSVYLSAYASRIDDFILIESNYAKSAGMGTRLASITRNVDARTVGAEAGVTQRFGTGWSADGSLAWVRGTNVTDGGALAQIPPLETRLGLQYDHERLSLGALARLAAAQNRIAVNQGTIVGQDFRATEGFTVLSANAGWRLTSAQQLTAGVDNLLNENFAEHISRQGASIPGFAVQTGQVREPGRTAWLRLSLKR